MLAIVGYDLTVVSIDGGAHRVASVADTAASFSADSRVIHGWTDCSWAGACNLFAIPVESADQPPVMLAAWHVTQWEPIAPHGGVLAFHQHNLGDGGDSDRRVDLVFVPDLLHPEVASILASEVLEAVERPFGEIPFALLHDRGAVAWTVPSGDQQGIHVRALPR